MLLMIIKISTLLNLSTLSKYQHFSI